MQKKQLETLLYSAGGVIALLAVLDRGQLPRERDQRPRRPDQGNVYTLSPGTRAVLSQARSAGARSGSITPRAARAVPVGAQDLRKPRRGPARRVQGGRRRQGDHREIQPGARFRRRGLGHARRRRGPAHQHRREVLPRALGVLPRPEGGDPGAHRPTASDCSSTTSRAAIAQVSAAKKPVIGVMSALPVTGPAAQPDAASSSRPRRGCWSRS